MIQTLDAVTGTTMKRITQLTIIALLLTAGCDLLTPADSCDPSGPLYPGLTPEQLAECDGDDSDGTPELTGDVVGSLSPGPVGFSVYTILSTAAPDVLSLWDIYVGDSPDVYEVVDIDTCAETGPLIYHVPNWGTPVAAGFSTRMDAYCGDGVMGHAVDSSRWSLCRDHGGGLSDFRPGESRYYPAEESYTAQGVDIVNDELWTEHASCREPSDNPASFCGIAMASVGDAYMGTNAPLDRPHIPLEWTCVCDDSDSACQAGAVCEAGYYLEGLHPVPTLCTWSGADGQPARPGGPAVYGLARWDDGVTAVGNDVVITSAMLVGATGGGAGLWNDAQSFDLDTNGSIEITWCGSDSLCAYLGLAEGDVITADPIEISRALYGEKATIAVRDIGGDVETWTFVVE